MKLLEKTTGKMLTFKQAYNLGVKNMPSDLKKAGFKVTVFCSNFDIHGSLFYRIGYCK